MQCKASNLQLAKDFIRTSFQPDLDSMEVQDKSQLKKEGAICLDLFSNHFEDPPFISTSDYGPKIKSVAIQAINQYRQACEKDLIFLRNNMLASVDKIHQLYLTALLILVAFGEHVGNDYERKKKLGGSNFQGMPSELNLAKNKVLSYLNSAPKFEEGILRHQANIQGLDLEIREWFREYVRTNEAYREYVQLKYPDIGQDSEILQTLLKKVIFKEDPILSFFYEKDLNWAENRPVVRSLALKLLKNAAEANDGEDFTLPEIAINWEEDKEFFQNIFNLTVQSEDEFRNLIATKTKNWDIERLASTDKIIITMALTEMTYFPSIPVKVSINEYIDISKTYSTPKSKQFVNGILDVLAKELTESGKIRKSGRGLLDNK